RAERRDGGVRVFVRQSVGKKRAPWESKSSFMALESFYCAPSPVFPTYTPLARRPSPVARRPSPVARRPSPVAGPRPSVPRRPSPIPMSDLVLRPRSATELIDAAFQVYRRAPVPFMVAMALIYVPWLALRLIFSLNVPETPDQITPGAMR